MKHALIVVDMINEFVHGKLGGEGARSTIPRINRMIDFCRDRGIPVIFLKDTHKEGDPELDVWGQHAMSGSEASEIIPEMEVRDSDRVIEKSVYSGFRNTDLENSLKDAGVKSLILAGVSTDICVMHNAMDAFMAGFRITVLSDGTAAIDEKQHEFGLDYMKRIHGAKVISTEEAIKEIGD